MPNRWSIVCVQYIVILLNFRRGVQFSHFGSCTNTTDLSKEQCYRDLDCKQVFVALYSLQRSIMTTTIFWIIYFWSLVALCTLKRYRENISFNINTIEKSYFSYVAQIFCQILSVVGQSKRRAQMDYLELDLFVAPMEMFMRQSVTWRKEHVGKWSMTGCSFR